jgi:hypothetical protein
MYRDAATALDERDRAVGSILIGEALIASCERAQVISDAHGPEAWRAIRDAHDDFPEIWRSLDQARRVLAQRGINVTGYDELRPHVRTRLATSGDDAEAVRVDPIALDDARRATGELKLAVPGADWAAIERRTSGLVQAPLLMRKRNRAILGAIAVLIALFAVAATLWVSSLNPQPRPDRYAAMRRELAEIARLRRVKIVEMQRAIGARCEPGMARELAKQLVMDGRTAEVRAFAADYSQRCGEDAVVVRWANAPAP